MASLSYATSGSGPTAGGIGWLDFSSYSFYPGSAYDISASFRDGSSISFNIRCTSFSNGGVNFSPTSPPISGSEFGSTEYTGISGNTVLATDPRSGAAGSNLRLTNIIFRDKLGNTVSNFTLFGCDAGVTDSGKTMFWYSNGTPWTLFTTIGSTTSPSVGGIGGDSVSFSGVGPNPGSNIISTQNPSEVLVRCEVPSNGSMALSIGFSINSVSLNKLIPIRRNSADQFELSISGPQAATTITSGVSNGVQSQFAQVFATLGNTYTVNESMAAGSTGTLSDYNSIVYLSNLTPGGTTVPSVATLGQIFTTTLGDVILATISNAPITTPNVVSASYASTGSGPSAGGIAWINFSSLFNSPFILANGSTIPNQTITLRDGSTMTFDISSTYVSGNPVTFTASTSPVQPDAGFGNSGYTGISGNVILYSSTPGGPGATATITLSNIVVRDRFGNNVPNFTLLWADAETTNSPEVITLTTNGGNWSLFTTLGSTSSPSVSGIGTSIVTLTGVTGSSGDNVLATQNPEQVSSTMTIGSGGKQGFAIGVAITSLELSKNINNRLNSADQFSLNISGTPSTTTITSGTLPGPQNQVAHVYAIPGNTYTVNETMAPGSVTPLSKYANYVVWSNTTPGGTTVPSTHNIGQPMTLSLGDIVTTTITNLGVDIGLVANKFVDKSVATIGDTLNYTVRVQNTSIGLTASNISFIDTIPIGAIFNSGSLFINGVSYPTLNPNPPGFTITTPAGLSPNGLLTINYSVNVSSQATINPVVNSAFVYGDYYLSIFDETLPVAIQTNTTTVPTFQANLVSTTLSTPSSSYAACGDIITFSTVIPNSGNVTALNVKVIDTIPNGMVFIPNSVKINGVTSLGASPEPPNGIMLGTIPPQSTVSVSYNVSIVC